jgi:hypothetical protein
MKPLFELPELLTLDGRTVTGDPRQEEQDSLLDNCSNGCHAGSPAGS